MNYLNQVFLFYDNFIGRLPANAQVLIAFLILVLIGWSIFSLFRQGHWIFAVILLLLLPGTRSAFRIIALLLWSTVKFLLVRIGVNL